MRLPLVDLGQPLYRLAYPAVLHSLQRMQWNGGQVIHAEGVYVDKARNIIIEEHRRGENEWLLFLDDDVAVPEDVLPRLVGLAHPEERPIVSGVYYKRTPPHEPIMYARKFEDTPVGFYDKLAPYRDFTPGDIVEVDVVGAGCLLVHRSVWDSIEACHRLVREDRSGGLGLISEDDEIPSNFSATKLHEDEQYPFFILQNGRGEDTFFCERARAAGIPIIVHTGVECAHWGNYGYTRDDFLRVNHVNR